jgi:GNAT superfamily N-acetyltransferase
VNSVKCFGLYDENKIIGFIAVIHQPHPINKKLKRISRLVILPDYQGIGLGTKFLEKIALYYESLGYELGIVTSAKNLISSLRKKENWILVSYGRSKHPKKGRIDSLKKVRNECYTARFMHKNN